MTPTHESNEDIAIRGVNCPFCKGTDRRYCGNCVHKFQAFIEALDQKDLTLQSRINTLTEALRKIGKLELGIGAFGLGKFQAEVNSIADQALQSGGKE